jgi:dihydropteroate synthase
VSALAAASGAWGVRVHNVPANRDAVGVGAAWRVRGRTPGTPEAGPQKR